MSILSSTNSGRKLAPITAGILEELGWIFNENRYCWDHFEYLDVEIYHVSDFIKETREKRDSYKDNWYAKEYINSIVAGTYGSINKTITRNIPLNSIGDLDLLENHRVIKNFSI